MANTVALNYSEAGQGTPLALLHGFPLSGAIWHQQQQLSDRYRVIVPDLRGHGRSPAPSGVYEMDLLARDVLAMLDALHIMKAAIVGHSMGGYVALAAWKLAPERFLALGLVASQAGADSEEGRQGRYKLANKVASDGSSAVAAAMIPKLFAQGIQVAPPILAQVRDIILKTGRIVWGHRIHDNYIGGCAVGADFLDTLRQPTDFGYSLELQVRIDLRQGRQEGINCYTRACVTHSVNQKHGPTFRSVIVIHAKSIDRVCYRLSGWGLQK